MVSATRDREKAAKGFSFLSNAETIVSIILLILLLARPPYLFIGDTAPNVTVSCASSLTVNSTACNQTTDCLQGFMNLDNVSCTYLPRPNSVTNCSSACYPTGDTECNGVGQCVGDTCVGSCTSFGHCDDLYPFNDALVFDFDAVTGWTYASWYTPYGCLLGSCVYAVLDIYAGSSENAIFMGNISYQFTPLGAQNQCDDYFLPSFWDLYRGCAVTERHLLASAVVDYNAFSNGDYGNETFPFQVSICVLRFTCAPSVPPAPITKRSTLGSNEIKTREEWGFLSTGTKETPERSHIKDPFARSLYWKQLREMVNATLPEFLHKFAAQPGVQGVIDAANM